MGLTPRLTPMRIQLKICFDGKNNKNDEKVLKIPKTLTEENLLCQSFL